MVRTWAPDDFWQVAQPLIWVPAARPQGGGKRRIDDRAVLAAIVYLVQAGCSWRKPIRGPQWDSDWRPSLGSRNHRQAL
jgi:transposase